MLYGPTMLMWAINCCFIAGCDITLKQEPKLSKRDQGSTTTKGKKPDDSEKPKTTEGKKPGDVKKPGSGEKPEQKKAAGSMLDEEALNEMLKKKEQDIADAEKVEQEEIARKLEERTKRYIDEQEQFNKAQTLAEKLNLIFTMENAPSTEVFNGLFSKLYRKGREISDSPKPGFAEISITNAPGAAGLWINIAENINRFDGNKLVVKLDPGNMFLTKEDEGKIKINVYAVYDEEEREEYFYEFQSIPLNSFYSKIIEHRKAREKKADEEIAKQRRKKREEEKKGIDQMVEDTKLIYDIFSDQGLEYFNNNKNNLNKFFSGVFVVGEDKVMKMIEALNEKLNGDPKLLFNRGQAIPLGVNNWYVQVLTGGEIQLGSNDSTNPKEMANFTKSIKNLKDLKESMK